jgi:hypothetical protein
MCLCVCECVRARAQTRADVAIWEVAALHNVCDSGCCMMYSTLSRTHCLALYGYPLRIDNLTAVAQYPAAFAGVIKA